VSHKGQPTGRMQLPAMLETPLTGPQEKLVQALARGLNKSAACREAGYGTRTSAYRALTLPNVAARLAALQADTAGQNRMSITAICERLLVIVERMEESGGTVAELNLARRALMDLAKLNGHADGKPVAPPFNCACGGTGITEIRRVLVYPDGREEEYGY
jgi:hypothetical protein